MTLTVKAWECVYLLAFAGVNHSVMPMRRQTFAMLSREQNQGGDARSIRIAKDTELVHNGQIFNAKVGQNVALISKSADLFYIEKLFYCY